VAKGYTSTDNAISPRPLSDIRGDIHPTRPFTLNETTLGAEQFDLLQQLFPHQKDFVVSDCGNLSSANLPLTFSGTFAQLFPWEKVHVDICIFGEGTARHTVLRIAITERESACAYLSQFSINSEEQPSPSEVAPTTALGSHIQNVKFRPAIRDQAITHMVFSTVDYTENNSHYYPEAWKTEFPVQQISRGLNFFADITLDDDLDRSLEVMLKGFGGGVPTDRALIDSGDGGPFLRFTRAMTGNLNIKPLRMNLTGTSLLLSLARPLGARSLARILVEGTVTIDTSPGLKVRAEYNSYYPELSLSFEGFPSLKQLLTHAGLKSVEDYFPEPLSQMLDIHLSKLTIVFELNGNYQVVPDARSVTGISLELTTPKEKPDIHLIKDLISLKPSLVMNISAPFDEESRSIEGDLKGVWTLEGTKFATQLAFPSLNFYAGMPRCLKHGVGNCQKCGLDAGQKPSTEKIVPRLLPGIDLPVLTLEAMEIEGNFRDKSFSANIRADILPTEKNGNKWGISNSRLEEIWIRMAYAHRQVTGCAVKCKLKLAGVFIYISAEHDAGLDGLQFEGRIVSQTLGIAEVIDDLNKLFGIPDEVPSAIKEFTIKALKVSFNTHSKDFTFTCDGDLKIEGGNEMKGTITIDLKHRQDGSFSTHFSGQITIGDDVQFALIFDSSDTEQLLAATYHDLEGKPKTSIKTLIEPVFPGLAVPESLEFTLHDALLGYHKSEAGSKWLFGVDIEGGLNLSDVRLPEFPLVSQFALPQDQTLKLAVQVVGAADRFEKDEVAALIALSPDGMRLPDGDIDGLALAASLRLGQECKQLSLPIGLRKNGSTPHPRANPLEHPAASSAADVVTADTPHSGAHAVSADGMQWIMIQKSFGPVHFERVGISYNSSNPKEPTITGLLDAALSTGGLTIALDGLSVTSPLSHFDPTFSLRGLGIDYRNGPLEIGGSFLKQTMKEGEETYTSFAGLAVLRNKLLSLSAIGSYSLKAGHPSLFIYAVLDYPLGGPSFFFVTGLAAGFGYNRGLIVPTIDQVEAFPLIPARSGQNGNKVKSLPAGQKEQQQLLTTRLEELEDFIPRSVGEHFLAIGLRFTSFKRVDSFALLTVKFGKELEFDLLGISTLSVPNVAEAQLLLKASFKPDSGFLGVRAQLTPNSYILSGDCHLTGGFAFYSWFKDQPLPGNPTIRGGDFVLTLGGYHPAYEPPAHYPRVPRLGFNWQVDKAGTLQLKGEAYYAMTPHALMAGCHLEATWHKDKLKAWFTAAADFLMSWEPYHYDARLYIDLGASYTFDLFGSQTITVDLGADLHLWGPEFSGEARIHWLFISFTVNFGKGAPTGLTPIKWEDFKTAFLPERNQICGIAVQQGLTRQVKDGVQERWIMNPKDLVLVTNSVVPSTAAREVTKLDKVGKPETWKPISAEVSSVAVRPVGVESMESTHTITITKQKENGIELVPFEYKPVLKAMPAALWGAPQWDPNNKAFLRPPDLHEGKPLTEDALCGFEIRPPKFPEPGLTAPFEPEPYDTELVPDAFKWKDWTLSNKDLQGKNAREAATGDKDHKKRDLLFKALGFANTGAALLAK
jgi:hypothetical protein